ncbi:hypothetical protein WR25_01126 isoform A [Diploscapter pachys]|uniref:EGF-like domain-containing protein n=1 Tax=Diploscapter pachys TaxID=2018661 RepID=A0A2A2KUP5_9BILA|nr:hypothetical protein WR25_01126 isoform A [Diploscapter pachys]
MNGTLENCEKFNKEEKDPEYEEFRCRSLRVNGEVRDGVCQCKPNWKGPICNEYHGCEEGQSLYGSVCTNNVCQHGGSLAVGKKLIECICPVPWDGRNCERLACWRKTDHGAEKRFRNAGDKCVCSNYYKGESCDEIISCLNGGTLDGSRCKCPDNFGGEICEKKCPKGMVTCSTCSLQVFGSILVTLMYFLFSR